MTTSTPLFIQHSPYGEQHPYQPLPCERSPRDPAAGQPVTLGIETTPTSVAEEVWCIWQIAGNPLTRRAEAAKTQPGAQTDGWSIQLPAFSGGEVIRYRLYAHGGGQQVESVEFQFGVSTWVDVTAVAKVEENAGCLTALLATSRPELFVRLQAEPDGAGLISIHLSALNLSGQLPHTPPSGPLTAKWGGLSLTLSGSPLVFELGRASDGLVLHTTAPLQVLVRADGSVAHYRLTFDSPSDEAFYGFGERFNALDQRGSVLDNHVYAQYINQGKRSYIPIPFFISSRGYGLWLASDRQAQFDLAAASGDRWTLTANPEEEQASLEIRIFLQPHPRAIVQAFTDLTGKPVLPPAWVFGLWVSSNDWNSQAEVYRQLELAEQHQIPPSVLVLEAWSDELTFYTWNDSQFKQKHPSQSYSLEDYTYPSDGRWPDPLGMIERLHQAGIRLVLWQIPVLKIPNPAEHLDETQALAEQAYAVQQGYVIQRADGSPHRIEAHSPWFANSLVLDFTDPHAEAWWFNQRRYLMEMGVDGFKTDGGEHIWMTDTRFHNGLRGTRGINRYPLAYESAYRRFVESQRGEDAVLFSRAGYTGIQQFSSHWAGDEKSTWDAFRATLHALLNVGLCGVSFIGWDLAGFAGELPSSDLYLRAAAFSVFCPIMQYHSDYNGRKAPSQDRTPWNIQERTGDTEIIPTFRCFTYLRLNLIPYILGQARESARTGLPLMRALPLEYPTDARCRAYPNEYLFGDALLVAPVTEAGQTTWPVYLPEGEWRDLWSGAVVPGGQEITVPVPRERIPVYQKKGSIVALNLGDDLELGSPSSASTDEIKNLVFLIFPGEVCQAEVSQGKDKPLAHIAAWGEAGAVHVTLDGLDLAVDLLVLGGEPEQVRLDGSMLPQAQAEPANLLPYWSWMPDRRVVRVHLPAGQGTVRMNISS